MDIIQAALATNNPTKLDQILPILDPKRFILFTAKEMGVEGKAVEDGKTLLENGIKKVRYVYDRLTEKIWVIADDTGLFIDALGGLPGVDTAVWAGEDVSEEVTMNYCLKQMEGIKNRRATFRTVAVLMSPLGDIYSFEGEARGVILEVPRSKPQPKMPYSPIFVPDDGDGRSWAEMGVEEENSISHRGKAFRQARDFLVLASHR